MRKFDFFHIALTGWESIIAIPLIFFTFSFYLFFDAGAAQKKLQQEKEEPCELIVYANELTPEQTARIQAIDSVLQTTMVYEIPVRLTVDQFYMDTVLYGISGNYLDPEIQKGILFPEDSGMPYLFLNEPALKKLMASGDSIQNSPEGKSTIFSYDWLNASVTVSISEETPVISKICGISASPKKNRQTKQNPGTEAAINTEGAMNTETNINTEGAMNIETDINTEGAINIEAEEACYISIHAAKNLLLHSGAIPSPSEMRIRIVNSGQEDAVTRELEAIGVSVTNGNSEKLASWEHAEESILHTVLTGAVSFLAAIALLKGKLDLDLAVHREEYRHLQQIFEQAGKPEKNLTSRIHRIRILTLLLLSLLFSAFLFWWIPILF